ncbi:saccharopine dehydrogenase family protein [Salinispira pacifica]|uniref:Carboxynorspermidine dehydrogenase, putative n=1 Tax=Salinispira pacifica TaxID=1307761 RepID=V5WIQ7_9SPIO|nr:saccharopine dehydrogenase family protein [Salinispira pacifica]AHC15722.1 Carboxynorspermidine dehydrogenase, putative [Salinispira pacifica]
MSKRVLIIGAGGVGQVVAHKCAMNSHIFGEITLASRTKSKCDAIARQIEQMHGRTIRTAALDADDVSQTVKLINEVQPDLVMNIALPYQDLPIMDACLETGVDYMDTANYEPKDTAKFEYSWQWNYAERFEQKGIMALLGSGFDPGVTNVFTAYGAKHYFDQLTQLDIIDVNGGDHGKPFATNFNPEINIREVTAPCRHYENGSVVETPAMTMSREFTCPENVGRYTIYRMYHEELESLTRHYPQLQKAQFWMSFSDNYLKHLEVLQNVGMTRIDEVDFNGQKIVPLQFLKAVLPEPSSLGPDTKGKTCIGTVLKGLKDGKEREVYIYNLCDHQDAYREVRSQAISYTTGVPAMIGAKMMLEKHWHKPGVWNMEQFDPDPFMDELMVHGLPWKVRE